jgi:hypothetical protein
MKKRLENGARELLRNSRMGWSIYVFKCNEKYYFDVEQNGKIQTCSSFNDAVTFAGGKR